MEEYKNYQQPFSHDKNYKVGFTIQVIDIVDNNEESKFI